MKLVLATDYACSRLPMRFFRCNAAILSLAFAVIICGNKTFLFVCFITFIVFISVSFPVLFCTSFTLLLHYSHFLVNVSENETVPFFSNCKA